MRAAAPPLAREESASGDIRVLNLTVMTTGSKMVCKVRLDIRGLHVDLCLFDGPYGRWVGPDGVKCDRDPGFYHASNLTMTRQLNQECVRAIEAELRRRQRM